MAKSQSIFKQEVKRLDATLIKKKLNQDQINFDFKVQNLVFDLHPVVRFQEYMQIFGEQLEKDKRAQGFHYPRFDNNLKFRMSQRLVLSLKELCCKVSLHEEQAHKSIHTSVESFSVQALD